MTPPARPRCASTACACKVMSWIGRINAVKRILTTYPTLALLGGGVYLLFARASTLNRLAGES